MTKPFTMNGVTTKVSATTTTAEGSIALNQDTTVMVTVVGTGPVFIASGIGSATATTSSTPCIGNTAQSFWVPSNHTKVAAITSTGTADVYFTVGSGV